MPSPQQARARLSVLLVEMLLGVLSSSDVAYADVPAPTKVLSVSFTSGHKLLSDFRESYRRGGKTIVGPEWTKSRNHPATHTGGKLIEATVELEADPSIHAGTARLLGQVRGGTRVNGESLVGSGVLSNGTITSQVKSTRALPKGIYKETLLVDWSVDFGQGPVKVDTTGPHVFYVTVGTPASARDPNEDIVNRYPSPLPPGVTVKRMEAAMNLLRKANGQDTTDTHALIGKLMELFPEFLLSKGSHYVNDKGGAWLLADAVADSGECQAIVRLIKAVLDIVGAPGQLALLKLYADPDNPTSPIELPWGAEQSPPPRKQMKLVTVGDQQRGLGVALLTRKPEFPGEDEAKPEYGDCWKVGPISAATDRSRFLTEKPSSFQGCLRATAEGSTQYYGGGIGGTAFASKEELFSSAFWGMVWTMLVPFPVQDRPAWDEKTTAVMKRIGVPPPPPKPRTPLGGKGRPEGFRMMEIIHIYGEDRCR
jgi:hypothetical protein